MLALNWRRPALLSLSIVPVMLVALASPERASAQCSTCVNAVKLPTGNIAATTLLNLNATSQLASTPNAGFFTLTLTGVAAGYSISSQNYAAWCAGWFNSPFNLGANSPVFSTYAAGFPLSDGPIVAGNTVNEVNYILNNKQGTVQDVQDAIWLVMTGQTGDTFSSTAQAMATAAQQNPSYIPNALGTMAVFYAVGPTPIPADNNASLAQFQSLFFEIPVPAVSNQSGCSGCVSAVTLPTTAAYSSATQDLNATTDSSTASGKGFFNVATTGVGAGFSITNQNYVAWCIGWFNSPFNLSGTSGFPIYNTYANNFPSGYGPLPATGNTINMINYILNHKAGTVQDVQDAIWIIESGASGDTPSANALAMVTAAKANPTYCPPTGGIIGLLLATGPNPIPTNNVASLNQFQSLLVEIICNSTTNGGGNQGTPGLTLKKTASVAKCNPFQKVTYTYVVTNTGTVPLSGIVVTDDNGTPGYTKDDFTVGTIAGPLAPGASVTLTASIYPPVTESANYDEGWGLGWGWSNSNYGFDYNNQLPGGTIICKDQGNGKLEFTYRCSTSMTDNSYGRNSNWDWGWWGHNFSQFAANDGAEFQILDSTGKVVLDFVADYISQTSKTKSGWGSLGIKGGNGGVYTGNAAHVLSVDTSLSHNLNTSSKYAQCTQDSPSQGTQDWDFEQSYKITINTGAACGTAGFGGVKCPVVSNNPSKYWGCDKRVHKPVSSTVTNIGTAAVVVNGATIKATATATVTVDASSQGWSQCGKY